VLVFNEQVQNIENSKASIFQVVSCFAPVKAGILVRQSGSLYIPSQVKSALRKLREGKDHDCDLFMSYVSVLYKTSVAHLAKWTTLFAEFKCSD